MLRKEDLTLSAVNPDHLVLRRLNSHMDERGFVQNRARALLAGERTPPIAYDVEIEKDIPIFLANSELMEEGNARSMRYVGARLAVWAHPRFFNSDARFPLIKMGVYAPVEDPTNLALLNNEFAVRAKFGADDYLVRYEGINDGAAVMRGVWPLTRVKDGKHPQYEKLKPLRTVEVNHLPFLDAGMSSAISWQKTFNMYDRGIVPDAHLEFGIDPKALNAEDVYEMPLVPAHSF